MTVHERYSEELSIVVVGSFNPAIFHPSWFVAEGLLPSLDVHEVDLDVVHDQVTRFTSDWLRLQVDPERFQASTNDSSAFDSLRDLLLGALRLLRHTPVRALGLNTTVHMRLGDHAQWEGLQERHAPSGPWNEVLEEPSFRGLSVRGRRPDGYAGYLHMLLEPSAGVEPGMFIALNDHFELDHERAGQPHGADLAIDVLAKRWDEGRERGRHLIDGVVAS